MKASQEISPIEGLKVDETLKPLHRYTVADRVDFSVAAAKCCPRIVEFAVAREAKPGTYALGDVALRIVDRELPPVKEWKGILDLWQHPWAVARTAGVAPFSPEHYAKMRPLWKMLAEAGGRALTVTIVDQPWNHQCYDAYESMVGKVRHADGRWTYDFTRFVELRRGLVAGEKFRILCAAGALDAAEVSAIRARFDAQKAMTGGTIFHQVEEWTEAALNKDVKDVRPVPKK